jgi:hypothetical protein
MPFRSCHCYIAVFGPKKLKIAPFLGVILTYLQYFHVVIVARLYMHVVVHYSSSYCFNIAFLGVLL